MYVLPFAYVCLFVLRGECHVYERSRICKGANIQLPGTLKAPEPLPPRHRPQLPATTGVLKRETFKVTPTRTPVLPMAGTEETMAGFSGPPHGTPPRYRLVLPMAGTRRCLPAHIPCELNGIGSIPHSSPDRHPQNGSDAGA